MSQPVRIHNARPEADYTVVVTDGHGHVTHLSPGKAAVVRLEPGEEVILKLEANDAADEDKTPRVRRRKPEQEPAAEAPAEPEVPAEGPAPEA